MAEGFDFVALGRALINDPQFVNKLRDGLVERSACLPCNRCIAEMDRPGGVRCVLVGEPGGREAVSRESLLAADPALHR